MNASRSSRISVGATILIVAIGAAIAWKDHRRLGLIKHEIESISPAGGDRTVTKHARQKRPAAPDVDIADVVAVAMDSRETKRSGTALDDATKKRNWELTDRIRALDQRQLVAFIGRVKECQELAIDEKRWFVFVGIQTVGDRDIQAALDLAEESHALFADTTIGGNMLSSLLESCAQADPLAAVASLRKILAAHPGFQAGSAKYRIVVATAVKDPQLAFNLVGELISEQGHGQVKSVVAAIAAAAVTDEDRLASLKAFREYLRTGAAPDHREELQTTVLRSMTLPVATAGFDPANKWLARANLTRDELWGFAGGLNGDFTKADTGRWIEWLGVNFPVKSLSHDEEVEWGDQVRGLIRDWAEADSAAASKWLGTLPPGDVHDYAVCGYARTLASEYPEIAAEWVATLARAEDRDRMMHVIYEKLSASDPNEASEFAERHRIK